MVKILDSMKKMVSTITENLLRLRMRRDLVLEGKHLKPDV